MDGKLGYIVARESDISDFSRGCMCEIHIAGLFFEVSRKSLRRLYRELERDHGGEVQLWCRVNRYDSAIFQVARKHYPMAAENADAEPPDDGETEKAN